jgi:hypothetical protein
MDSRQRAGLREFRASCHAVNTAENHALQHRPGMNREAGGSG